jgi:hypothetical protein
VSVQAITWAYEQDAGSSMAQFLLVTLANSASEQGVSFLGRKALAERCHCSPKCVTDNIAKLDNAGLLTRVQRRRRNGSRTSDWVVLAPLAEDRGGMTDAPADDYPEEIVALARVGHLESGERGLGELEGRGQVNVRGGPEPLVEPSDNQPPSSDQSASEAIYLDVPDEMRSDAEALLRGKRKVNGRLVTPREMGIAASALAEHNRQAKADYGIGPWLTPIVMHIRERPSADAGVHVRLVQSAWRMKWWERNGSRRRPQPTVIYGDRSFERTWQDARDEAEGRPIVIERRLKDSVARDGRTWDEWTANEQQAARENASIGIFPEDHRRGARAEPSEASEPWHPEPFTVDNF